MSINDVRSNRMFVINSSNARIWSLLFFSFNVTYIQVSGTCGSMTEQSLITSAESYIKTLTIKQINNA